MTCTGELVLPTYPLKLIIADELKKQVQEGRLSMKGKQEDNIRYLLGEFENQRHTVPIVRL